MDSSEVYEEAGTRFRDEFGFAANAQKEHCGAKSCALDMFLTGCFRGRAFAGSRIFFCVCYSGVGTLRLGTRVMTVGGHVRAVGDLG